MKGYSTRKLIQILITSKLNHLDPSIRPMCIWNYLLIPDCHLVLLYCRYVYVLRNTPLTPSCEFHNSGVWISVRGFDVSITSHKPPIIGGTSVLKSEITTNFYLVILALSAWTSSLLDSSVDAVYPTKKSRYITMYKCLNSWPCYDSYNAPHFAYHLHHHDIWQVEVWSNNNQNANIYALKVV